jgi:phenylalanyl-tRNA synthetase beta chain
VEEVLRVHGFDRVPAVPMALETALPEAAITPAQRRVTIVKRALAARGLLEAVTFSFMDGRIAGRFTAGNRTPVALANPIAADLDVMRPSIPDLLPGRGAMPPAAAATSRLRGRPAICRRHARTGWATAPLGGAPAPPTPSTPGRRPVAARGVGAPVDNLSLADAPGWYHPGRSGCSSADRSRASARYTRRCWLRSTSSRRSPRSSCSSTPCRRQRSAPARRGRRSRPPSSRRSSATSPSSSRLVPAEKLIRAVKGADKALIQAVSLFDLFEGGSLGAGRKSLAVSVTLQAMDCTLTEQDIAAVSERIVAAATKATGAELRR